MAKPSKKRKSPGGKNLCRLKTRCDFAHIQRGQRAPVYIQKGENRGFHGGKRTVEKGHNKKLHHGGNDEVTTSATEKTRGGGEKRGKFRS